jgi:uncharacterized protein (TIGR03086 family)
MALPDEPAARYAVVAAAFTDRVEGTTDWDAPSPVVGWAARDVVWHLVDWIPDVLRVGASPDLPRRDLATSDPPADWARFNNAMLAIVGDTEITESEFAHPMAGTMPVQTAIDMLVTPDVFLHSWDLDRAMRQSIVLDAGYAGALLAGMEGIEDMLRSSGHYDPRVGTAADADVRTRLIAFIGRDPNWEAGDLSRS